MRRGVIFSAVLHLVVLALVFFGLPSLFAPDDPIDAPIPVDIYTIEDETIVPLAPKPRQKPKPEPDPHPEKAKAPDIPPPPESVQIAEPAPPPRLPEPAPPEPVAKKPPPPAPPPPPKPVQVAKAKPEPKPEKKPEKKKKKAEPQQNFSTLLKDLAAKQEASQSEKAKETPVEPPPKAVAAPVVETRDEPLSLTVQDAIRRQVEEKWSVPVGARDAAELTVEIRITLQPDGRVTGVQIVDQGRMKRLGEKNFIAMAESARRAVWLASPLQQLPPEKYKQWREITFTFRPPA